MISQYRIQANFSRAMHNCFKSHHLESLIKSFKLHVNTCASSFDDDGRYFGEQSGVKSMFGIKNPRSGSSTVGGANSWIFLKKKFEISSSTWWLWFEFYRFDAADNGCIAQFNNRWTISGANWFYVDANRSEGIKFTSIRSYTVCQIISIVLFRMDNSTLYKWEET